MKISSHPVLPEINAKEAVLPFIEALNKEDFKAARKYVSEDMEFKGVLGSRDGAEAYFNDMEKMKFKYHIEKIFVNGDDVCLLYNIDMAGTNIFTCGWYHVSDGKIDSIRVVFDPRPILEQQAEKKN